MSQSLTFAARPLLLTFGAKAAGAGTVSTAKAGENVDVLAQQCGATAAQKLSTDAVSVTSSGMARAPMGVAT